MMLSGKKKDYFCLNIDKRKSLCYPLAIVWHYTHRQPLPVRFGKRQNGIRQCPIVWFSLDLYSLSPFQYTDGLCLVDIS